MYVLQSELRAVEVLLGVENSSALHNSKVSSIGSVRKSKVATIERCMLRKVPL